MAKEIAQRQEEIKDLKQTITDKHSLLEFNKKEYKDLLESVENYKNDYVQVNSLPNQIAKECDRLLSEAE